MANCHQDQRQPDLRWLVLESGCGRHDLRPHFHLVARPESLNQFQVQFERVACYLGPGKLDGRQERHGGPGSAGARVSQPLRRHSCMQRGGSLASDVYFNDINED